MDTAVNMRIVGSEMEHFQELQALLEPILGVKPAISSRLEIVVGGARTIVTLTEDEITVRDEPEGRVTQGDWDLARAALAGMPPLPDPPPDDGEPEEPDTPPPFEPPEGVVPDEG